MPGRGTQSHPTEELLVAALQRGRGTRRLDVLLDRALASLPARLRGSVIVFGSAPMVLAGIRPDPNDLDLFVSEQTYEALLAAKLPADEDEHGHARVVLAEDVEVFKSWPGVGFAEVLADAVPVDGSRGLKVAALRHVLAFKLFLNRAKDQPDIAALRQVVGA